MSLTGRPARRALVVAALLCAVVATVPPQAAAAAQVQQPVTIGSAGPFGVLAVGAVPNTGLTVVAGDLGAAGAVTGFPPGEVTGTTHVANGVFIEAKNAATAAYDDAGGRTTDTVLSGQDLGGLTLPPGVYGFGATAQLTGDVTLDGGGRSDAVFIFQIGTTLGSSAASRVLLTNGASACNVFWRVGSASTLGAGTILSGNLVAGTTITVGAGSSVTGRLVALAGPVTIDSTAVSPPACGSLGITAALAGDFADRAITGTPQTTEAVLEAFSVTDSRGNGAGWHVTALASTFIGATRQLAAGSLSMSAPHVTPGDTSSPPPTVAPGAQIIDDGAVTIASAAAGAGMGTYGFASMTLTLALPGDVFADSYTSAIVISVVNGP